MTEKVRRKSKPVFFKAATDAIDRTAGVIKGCVVGQIGEDKHGDLWDDTFLEQLVVQGNSSGVGVKSRFGHPNVCDSKIDSFIGRYKNFSISQNADGKSVVIADLHLDPVCKALPGKGDVFTYLMDMATKNSDMFGNSIAYIPAKSAEKKEKDSEGNDVVNYYERLGSLLAVDVVDSPAATDNLFKDSDDLASIVTEFLEDHSEIFELVEKDNTIIDSFLNKYKSYKKEKEKMATTKKPAKTKSKAEEVQERLEALKKGTEDVAKSYEATTKSGTSVTISDENADGKPDAGDTVTDTATGTPVVGETELDNGIVLVTDEGGVITEMKDPETSPAMATDEAAVKALGENYAKVKAENDSLKKEIADLNDAHEKQIESISKSVETLEVRLKKMEGTYKPDTGETKFSKEKESDEKSLKEKMKEREKEIQARKDKRNGK